MFQFFIITIFSSIAHARRLRDDVSARDGPMPIHQQVIVTFYIFSPHLSNLQGCMYQLYQQSCPAYSHAISLWIM